MTRSSLSRVWAVGLLVCLSSAATPRRAGAQIDQTEEAQLVAKAKTLEARNRVDLAKQTWQQVLNSDPNQPDALAGMARANMLEHHPEKAQEYLSRLKAVSPNDPNLDRIQNMHGSQDDSGKLQEAGRLAQAGQYARAMTLLREVYGNNPPPGDPALSYYQTEAATEEGRPQAVAGLRTLIDKYPQDSRYQIALGKILTYNPRTRSEGRKLLEKHPADPEAQAALRQSLVWDEQNPGTAPDIKAYLEHHRDPQLQAALQSSEAQARRSGARRGVVAPPPTAEELAVQAAVRQRNAEQQAAYNALNAKRMEDAEARFKALIAKNPQDYQSLAGLGYVRMNQSNFGGAISYFEQAEQDGDKDPAIERALKDSRFYYTMQTATAALNENNLPVAEQEFRAALMMRPNDPTALQGLGGTLLKGQQNDRAAEVYATYVHLAPGDRAAWRGLFMAEYGAGKYSDALEVDRRIPPALKRQLARDPDYLRTLASTYLALGRDADAQRVLRSALELPFPDNGKGLMAEVQLQYAALLATADHHEQAAALDKQVIAANPNNQNAWIGLVQNEHQLGDDAAAYEALRTMPASVYTAAMQEAGFETTVAAIYEGENHDELAQQVLEQFLAQQQAQGKQPFAPAQVQLASLYLRHGDAARAYPLYHALLEAHPDSADAWNGLLGALHATGHDQEALAQLQAIPPNVRKDLENNPSYLQTVGSVYASLGDSQQALRFFARVQQHYATQHAVVPADLDVQEAWLLYNTHSDAALRDHLLRLGDRKDLNDQQRLTVETIWANFAVRRANEYSAAGNPRMALAILNAAAQSFPTNQQVLRALGGGYASAGMPREAVAIFRSQNLNVASAGDYRAAVGAALAAADLHDAETWLRFGLEQYPRDPQMLVLAARFEAARGDPNRAAEYYRAALSAMPAGNPGTQLASAMAQPAPQPLGSYTSPRQPQDLATLLGEPMTMGTMRQPAPKPYLPSYSGGTGTLAPATGVYTGTPNDAAYGGSNVPGYGEAAMPAMPATNMALGTPATGASYTPGAGASAADSPDIGGYPVTLPESRPSGIAAPVTPKHSSTLGDYAPHSQVMSPELPGAVPAPALQTGSRVVHLHANRALEAKYGPYVSYDPSQGTPHFVGTGTGLGDGIIVDARRPVSLARLSTATSYVAHTASTLHEARYGLPGPQVAEAQVAQPVQQPGAPSVPLFSPRPGSVALRTAPDGTPIVPYASTAKVVGHSAPAHTAGGTVQQRAAAIRENQAAATPQMSGVSHPPAEGYDTSAATLNPAQYTNYGGQITQPGQGGYSSSSQQSGSQTSVPGMYGESNGQQYPQPGMRTTGSGSGSTNSSSHASGSVARHRHTADVQNTSGADQPATTPVPQQTPMQYPGVAQPLENFGPPQIGAPYPLGQAPTDYDLQQRNLPPLRGYFDPRTNPRAPLTERQQTELDLAQIEGSYSNWLGGSVLGRYRSGTPGIDRLAVLKAPFEASFVFANSFRLSIIPEAVFLNSGTLNTNGGNLGTGPVLGTYLGTNPNNPSQQFASGVGGEVQLATNTFSVAIGTTPYQFLVENLIGRGRWRPGNGHVTLYGGRDAVEETQLSYAGLRDPGSSTITYGGNVWGGVVLTGGGVRFDVGDERSGLYVQGEGGVLTGYHVLQNQKADGLAGAYFRVKYWPEYGTLNIGGAFYGEHFTYNERGESYGLGGYFSPEAYFLAAVPVTFTGHYGTDLHYSINGAVGIQTFQEDNENYFPLDPGLLAVAGCTLAQYTNHTCGLPVNSSTGLNFSFDSEVSYRVNEHWYVGGFLSANNTNNYDTVSGGFFARYTFRPQYPTADYPTGLFPVEGFRPLRVP